MIPEDQRRAVTRHLNELDRLAADLATFDTTLARRALTDPRAAWVTHKSQVLL